MDAVTIEPSSLPAPESIASSKSARNTVLPWTPSPFASGDAHAVDLGSLHVEVTRSLESMAAVEAAWQSLADEAIDPNPFYEPWMVLPALQYLTGAEPLFVLIWGRSTFKKERVLCGLIPLTESRLIPALGARSPRLWTVWKYPFCYLTAPLLRRGVPRETLAAFLRWLSGSGQAENALLKLEEFPGEGATAQALTDVLRAEGWRAWQSETLTRAFFRPAPNAERFFESAIASKRRKEWRRLTSRLQEHGTLEVEEISSLEGLRSALEAFVKMEAAGWKGRDGVAVACDEGDRIFFEEMCRHAALRGRLQLLALKVAGRPVAMKLNLFAGGGEGFAFKITYDEAWAKFSPGVLLELENVQRLHAAGRAPWMDSCAAPNRFMINQLWPERRQLQTLFLSAPSSTNELVLAALPLIRWGRGQVRLLRQRLTRKSEALPPPLPAGRPTE